MELIFPLRLDMKSVIPTETYKDRSKKDIIQDKDKKIIFLEKTYLPHFEDFDPCSITESFTQLYYVL